MGFSEHVPSVFKVFSVFSSRKRKPAPTPAGEQDAEEAANDSPAKRVKPTTGGQQIQAVNEGLQRASTSQYPLPAKESKQDDGLEALKLLQPFKPSPQNPANNLFKAFEGPVCMPLAALSRGNQPRGFTNNSLRTRAYTNRDGKRTSLQAKQQLQQPSYLDKRVPGWQTGSRGTSSTHTSSFAKHMEKEKAEKQEEDDDDVVLISDSDDEQSAQQQQEEEDYGTEQPSLAHRQLVNGHSEQDGAEDYESGVETDEEQAEESEASEGSDEEAAAEAAAGIGALELGWLAPAGPWAPTQQEQQRFQTAVHSGPMTKVLVMHPKANIELTRELLQCMRHGQWLNDEVMNFYMALLQDRDAQLQGQPGVPSCHFFNTFFVNKLIKDAGVYKYQNVQKWTLPKRLKLSSQVRDCVLKCDRVIIPVHEGVHWTCAMVDLQHKRLLFFDSLQGRNKVVMDALRRWVQDEAKDKLKQDWDVDSWPEHFPSAIPRQTNGCDCGVFTLLYASRLGLGRLFDFRQDDLLVDARVKMTCELLDIKIHSTP
eukprot:gene5601-5839_t